MSTDTIDRTEATDVAEPITETTGEPEVVEVNGETVQVEDLAKPVQANPEVFETPEAEAENAKLYKECVDLLRDQLLGETDRNLALGLRVRKLCEHQRNHCPKFEDQDVLRVCNNIWNMVALEISLPEKNNLDRCLAYYLFTLTAAEQFKLQIHAKKVQGKPRKPILPFTVFDRHILPTALDYQRGKLSLEVKVKWFAWLQSLLSDIVESGKKFSRSDLDKRVDAERKRQRDEGKSADQLEKEAERADRSARKAKRETIVKGFSTAVSKAVDEELFTASQLVNELVSACVKGEMEDVPTIGGVDPATLRTEDIDSMIAVMVHYRRVDVMLNLQSKLSAAIAKIQSA